MASSTSSTKPLPRRPGIAAQHRRRFFLVLATLASAPLAGCSKSVDHRGPRVEVHGHVYFNGEPVSRATIVFRDSGGQDKMLVRASIVDGGFRIPRELGPPPGHMRVEIYPETIDAEEFEIRRNEGAAGRVSHDSMTIPPKYDVRSSPSADLFEGTENIVNVELASAS